MKHTFNKLRDVNFKPTFKFKRHLDPPWTGTLGTSIKLTSALILLNTTLILLLGIVSAASTDLSASKTSKNSTYIQNHSMLVQADLIFFYVTISVVWVASNVTENWVLWEDKLRPLYVICAAVIAINVWILQLTLWGPCMFAPAASGKGEVSGPGYCPYLFRNAGVDIGELQSVGSPSMVFYGVPSLFILYIAYLTLGVVAYRQEKKRPQRTETFDKSKTYASSSRESDPESLPFRMSWPTGNSPPKSGKSSPDRDSYMSPKTRKEVDNGEEEGETTPSLRAEPAIALMLTTPHGSTEEADPFDDDRLSRLGHRTN